MKEDQSMEDNDKENEEVEDKENWAMLKWMVTAK
jgi:hypothetical protein